MDKPILRLYEKLDSRGKINSSFVKEGIVVENVSVGAGNLEDYFTELVGVMKLADIVYCELMKLKRSKIILIGILGSLIVPFLVVTNDIRICFSNPSIVLSLGGIYEDIIMFIMLLFGSLVMSVVAAYLVSREYTEKH